MHVNTREPYKRSMVYTSNVQKDPTYLISAWKSTREALAFKYEILVTLLSGSIGYQQQQEWKTRKKKLSGGNRFDKKFVHILAA